MFGSMNETNMCLQHTEQSEFRQQTVGSWSCFYLQTFLKYTTMYQLSFQKMYEDETCITTSERLRACSLIHCLYITVGNTEI